jgi:hypothetical protein
VTTEAEDVHDLSQTVLTRYGFTERDRNTMRMLVRMFEEQQESKVPNALLIEALGPQWEGLTEAELIRKAVEARMLYEAERSENRAHREIIDHLAAKWLAIENLLDDSAFDKYMRRYRNEASRAARTQAAKLSDKVRVVTPEAATLVQTEADTLSPRQITRRLEERS